MTTLIVYDSLYGNTKKVAEAIGKGIGTSSKVKVLSLETIRASDLQKIEYLIVGSPTQAGRPTPTMQSFLSSIPKETLTSMKTACFDTRMPGNRVNIFLKVLLLLIGYAAPKMEKIILQHGGLLASTSEGFYVVAKEGPLEKGELDRAAKWGKKIVIAFPR